MAFNTVWKERGNHAIVTGPSFCASRLYIGIVSSFTLLISTAIAGYHFRQSPRETTPVLVKAFDIDSKTHLSVSKK